MSIANIIHVYIESFKHCKDISLLCISNIHIKYYINTKNEGRSEEVIISYCVYYKLEEGQYI